MSAYVISELKCATRCLRNLSHRRRQIDLRNMAAIIWSAAAPSSVVEGGPPAKNIVVVEFPSMAHLREWYASPEYAQGIERAIDALKVFGG